MFPLWAGKFGLYLGTASTTADRREKNPDILCQGYDSTRQSHALSTEFSSSGGEDDLHHTY